ncbi:hypothetical protein [Streptomyces sp. RTGN2]|uniref:hypothetical protein n=1 Tax=Streptomyces sp. RTGN2 TaxID=3016525 RepID=UPI00255283FE|nr:hypothetical protein [Streptomyces sp. RTGN2]
MAFEWGDGAGLIGAGAGIIGLVLAAASLSKAKQANKTADQGLNISRTANGIAEAANALARHANEESATSNELAREANAIARGANQLAQDANDLFHQQERRGVESHDVHWDGEWVSPGVYGLRNDGTHTAYDVNVTVTVVDETVRATTAQVVGGEHITLDFPQARRQYADERRDREEQEARRQSAPFHALGSVNPLRNFHFIEERVHWKTELGTPKEHTDRNNLRSLGNFD